MLLCWSIYLRDTLDIFIFSISLRTLKWQYCNRWKQIIYFHSFDRLHFKQFQRNCWKNIFEKFLSNIFSDITYCSAWSFFVWRSIQIIYNHAPSPLHALVKVGYDLIEKNYFILCNLLDKHVSKNSVKCQFQQILKSTNIRFYDGYQRPLVFVLVKAHYAHNYASPK